MLDKLEYKYIQNESFNCRYYLVPWDIRICGFPVAQIDRMSINDGTGADLAFGEFIRWCENSGVVLCSCRLSSRETEEALLLQRHGFYFVEMSYQPELNELQSLSIIAENNNPEVEIVFASEKDIDSIAEIAKNSFSMERFHVDPFLGKHLGDLRYETWARTSFANPKHQILKIMVKGEIAGFFIIENSPEQDCYWHLTALSPQFQGCGLGSIVWKKVLQFVKQNGAKKVRTSISARNTAVLSIYSKLSFRFPMPTITFHWHSAMMLEV